MKLNKLKSPSYHIAGLASATAKPPGDAFLNASLDWIRENPLASNQEVPPRFVVRWICNGERDVGVELALTIFMFGYCQRQLMKQSPLSSANLTISASEVSRLFDLWQMKLGLAELNRTTDLRTRPLPLFDFPADESVSFWMNGGTDVSR